jgi:hypothetical protein
VINTYLKRDPGDVITYTLWGELAYQLVQQMHRRGGRRQCSAGAADSAGRRIKDMEGTADMEMTTVQTKLPTRLLTQMQSLVSEGWFQDVNDLILNALRRFLETHRPELMEHYIWEDVEWGLHGEE